MFIVVEITYIVFDGNVSSPLPEPFDNGTPVQGGSNVE